MWHQLSATSRRLVGDITSLRKLLRCLIDSDAVEFLQLLEAQRQVALSSLGLPDQVRRTARTCPAWFLTDQADRLLSAARNRVYSNYSKKQVHIELNPKWLTLVDIIKEICYANSNDAFHDNRPILILTGRENTARSLERFLRRGPRAVRRFLSNDSRSDSPYKPSESKVPKTIESTDKSTGSSVLTLTQCYRPVGENASLTARDTDAQEESEGSSNSASDSEQPDDETLQEKPAEESLPLGCRRVRVSTRLLPPCAQKVPVHVIIRIPPTAAQEECVSVLPENSNGPLSEDYLIVNGHRLGYVLDRIQPHHVILYQPRVAWVRELEVHSARRHVKPVQSNAEEIMTKEPGDLKTVSMTVFFMLYENSVEEQCYLTSLRREKEAFESLIDLSSRIVIPKDAPLTILASDQSVEDKHPRVIVDMREFRSELPALLHRKGLKVSPMTLSVADYILAPHLCVERKSVSDLIGSLNSGRLYQQCTAMSRHYPNPVLLIEFSLPTKAFGSSSVIGGHFGSRGGANMGFSLYSGRHSIQSGGEFDSRHLLSKLTLLTIHFPNLRIFWSVTPYCTAELFTELKQGRAEPSVERLPQDGEHLEDHNVEAVDMLLKIPGISWKNYRRVMDKLTSLHDLAQCSFDKLIDILDSRECATKVHNFLHTPCDLPNPKETGGDEEKNNTKEFGVVPGIKRSAGENPRGARLFLAGRVRTNRGRGRGRGRTGDST
ncbi:DNA repair endonuclease XPF [Fasciola gigantica]|uniref:DNA repair endonuclease XPF n=1 Tax=Fasciola gigantica TaxID=46835 RepID=A0A504ZCX7_FASGI|nr:DNA repair endonuclease XPF [Fasciola gigantica]